MDDEWRRDRQSNDMMSANKFEVRVLDKNEFNLWDHLAAVSPQGTIFHNSEYLQIVADASSSRLRLYGCFSNDDLVGGCSLLVKGRGRHFSRASSTGPLTPYGGFLLPSHDDMNVRRSFSIQDDIINALCDQIEEDRYSSVTVTNSPDLLDIRSCLWRGWKGHVAYTHYIELRDEFIKRFSKSVRREIRKAGEAGLYVERCDDAEKHHDLLGQVFGRQDREIPVDKSFFKAMLSVIKREDCGGMWIVRDGSDNIMASRIWIWDNKRAYAWSAASNQEFRNSGANQFLFFSLLREMQKRGFNEVNIMHGNTKRLSYHAAGYNPTLVPYYTVNKNNRILDILRNI
jgi:hypothetical protein